MKPIKSAIYYQQCGVAQLHDLLALQEVAFQHLAHPALLRRNSEAMLLECLQPPHYTVGAFDQEELVAIGILYNPIHHPEEALSPYLQSISGKEYRAANYKLCIVHPDYRGHHLQQVLGRELESYARREGIEMLCSTASPENGASISNLLALGYQLDHTLTKYGHERNLYYKLFLQS